jgi:hypothetical protein
MTNAENSETRLVSLCAQAGEHLATLRGYDAGTTPRPNDDVIWSATHGPAWSMIEEALAIRPVTLAGAKAQLALLTDHLEVNQPNPTPEIIACLRNIASVIEKI